MVYRTEAVIDLIDTYSSIISLPICLIDAQGEEKIGSNINGPNFTIDNYDPILEVGKKLKHPTIISIFRNEEVITKFVISPPIHSEESGDYFLACGPFQESHLQNLALGIPTIKEEEKYTIIHKLEHLTEMISIFFRDMDAKYYRKKLATIDKDFSFFSDNLEPVFEQVMTVNNFDFIGYAQKKERDHFFIKMTHGKDVKPLLNQTFFIGEGLLGQAVASGNQVYWNGTMLASRAEYFNKYGLYPSHLFCFPIKIDDEVCGLVFGGRIQNNPIHDEMLNMVRSFTLYLTEREKVQAKLESMNRSTNYLNGLIDILEVFMHAKDNKSLIYKILYACSRLNGEYSIYLTLEGERYERGPYEENTYTEHQKIAKGTNAFVRTSEKLIHVLIEWDDVRYGVLTVQFPSEVMEEQKVALDIIRKLLSMKCMLTKMHAQRPVHPEGPQKEEISSKEIEELTNLETVIHQLPLTKREQEILNLILEGLNNPEVADYLNISAHTVKNHITNIFRKLNVTDRVQAMAKIYRIKYNLE